MKAMFLLAVCTLAVNAVSASAADAVIETPKQLKWADAPQFGKGVQTAVLAGDPSKEGPYVMRIKFPAGAMVPAHTHDKAENVTVISGTFGLGMGKQADKTKGQKLPAGSFFRIDPQTPHFAWESDAIVQVNGMGPASKWSNRRSREAGLAEGRLALVNPTGTPALAEIDPLAGNEKT
jgi:quercetin dioxygenase-like cupin family protein